ncbi:MAG: hypothetical protein ACLPKE_03350 [Streptosporangiaceae bacterium]
MSRSACRAYVQWYNEKARDWATWVPGATIEPGSVGSFDEQLRFCTSGMLPVIKTDFAPRPGIQTLSSNGDISFSARADGKLSPTLHGIGDLAGGVKITASRANACFLHLDDVYESWVCNERETLTWVAGNLSKFDLGEIIVMKRLEARRGFAAISEQAGASFEVSASAGALPLGAVEVSLHAGRNKSGFLFYEFGPGKTPVFSRIFRVNRGLWDRLLPWRHDGPVLIRPDGKRYRGPGLPPSALAGVPPEGRRYDPERSAMTRAELSAITIEDLFEQVTSISDLGELDQEPLESGPDGRPDDGAVVYFPLPAPTRPAALAAADPADGAPPRRQATTADGRARLALFDRGGNEWWVEVSPTSRELAPVVVPVRYRTVDGSQQELLVPLDDRGSRRMPTSVARLWDYDGSGGTGSEESWEAANPVPLDVMSRWPPDVLASSVRAAVSAATVRAWERVATDGPPGARPVIARTLHDLENEA